jgi:protein tyrosine phosphatase (PTP) superfamily phosphohydrolase (DUF442 family)
MFQRREFLVLTIGPAVSFGRAHAITLDAPNPVEISTTLITSGQPSPKALSSLGSLGVQAVIYLAPSSVPDAVKNEPELLRAQGIEFVHIPIPFQKPTEEHFNSVSDALTRLQGNKVLVHCQVNLRASTMVFLHRVIALRQDPAKAYEAVSQVWSPEGPWRELVLAQLKKHKVNFQLL